MRSRRDFLKFLGASAIGLHLDIEKLLWVPGEKTIFIPSEKQILYYNGIPYHESTGTIGTWLGIERSSTPFPFRETLKKIMLYPNKPLYIEINES